MKFRYNLRIQRRSCPLQKLLRGLARLLQSIASCPLQRPRVNPNVLQRWPRVNPNVLQRSAINELSALSMAWGPSSGRILLREQSKQSGIAIMRSRATWWCFKTFCCLTKKLHLLCLHLLENWIWSKHMFKLAICHAEFKNEFKIASTFTGKITYIEFNTIFSICSWIVVFGLARHQMLSCKAKPIYNIW